MARQSPAARRSQRQGKVEKVMHEWGEGELHSGSASGPVVPHTGRGQKQAVAIALSEQRRANRKKRR